MKSALITGITGMVGSHLCDYLLKNTNWKIYGLCRWRSPLENIEEHLDLINREIDNLSLFSKKQILIIDQVSDKIYDLIEKIIIRSIDMKIYFFSDQLDKRSKLRSFFEKRTECGVVACYQDNEITLKKKNYCKSLKVYLD